MRKDMKKQISYYALLAAGLLTIAACSNDTQQGTLTTDGRTALQVTSGIQTRAHDNLWDAKDAIGIYMLEHGSTTIAEGASNRKYTTDAEGTQGTFTPATGQTIYFPVNDATRCDLVAYYPHTAIGSDNLYKVDVNTQNPQRAIDLMAAEKIENKHKNDCIVQFNFVHKLVKLDITLKSDGTISAEQLTGTVVNITNQQASATYNILEGGNVIPATTTPLKNVTLLTKGMKVEGIVLPSNSTESMFLTFTVPALDNQMFKWAIKKAEGSPKFEAGKKYKYTITIGKQELSVTSTVTDWIPGNSDGETGNAE